MKYPEKKEDKIKILEKLLYEISLIKIKYREWKLIHDMFINLISTEKLEPEKIKLYATILMTSSVECYYLDDEYLLKTEMNKLKTLISLLGIKDTTSNKNYNFKKTLNSIYELEENIQPKQSKRSK